MLRFFVGYDSREPLAFHVFSHSIARRASVPVSVAPVMLSQLGGLYRRARGPTESTEFSISRFLVPYLSNYEGWSVFADCDMLCLADVGMLEDEIEKNIDKAALVVKHDYTPSTKLKFLGQKQTVYPRKNWSSLMVLNNERCRRLTPDYIAAAPASDLHRFAWLKDEEIGELPLAWNWLVGEFAPNPSAKILHFTLGGPWFQDYKDCDHANLWRAELAHMTGLE